ncbi:ATP-binding cassette domain-containing protein [Mycoplasma procyoni]|uniref:ATP-binding cassette domain-containing protein n=1 Tax=Mycoplasma procyoni TaxID=568784 RepID=UPI00197BAD57|nr:ATP-binding cassette domain-containing protein [Mycoplasma procyoni]MBN3535096.1 ATP-binding cassette domain-containing protein [Mycoplasma procyoni]
MINKENVILDVKNLKKYFYNKSGIVKAVDKVNFKLFEGEVLGLIGESGSGKTTIGRSLVRLYENYNGQVRLLNKIVSGKKLSRKTNKFMRKNLQMIFQDPHASLNGQKNVYSILKEPLKTNKIIKDDLKDIFADWKLVTQNFKYTFIKAFKEQQLKNALTTLEEANLYLGLWDHFKDFDFDKLAESNSDEDIFNAYFVYLGKRQFHESKAINQMYKGSSQLYSFYFQKQKEFRNGELSYDEKALEESRQQLKKAELLTKFSPQTIQLKELLEQKTQQLKDFKATKQEELTNSQNFLDSSVFEFKSEYLLNKDNALNSPDFQNYSFFMKRAFVNKIAKRLLQRKKHALDFSKNIFRWLSLEEIEEIVEKLNVFNKEVVEKFENSYIKVLDEQNNFETKQTLFAKFSREYSKLDLKPFINTAKQKEKHYNSTIALLEKEIASIQDLIKQQDNKIDPYYTASYNLTKAVHKKNEHVFKHELDAFVADFKLWEQEIDAKILAAQEQLKAISKKQKDLDLQFITIHKKFLVWLEKKLLAQQKDKEHSKHIIKQYAQKVEEKLGVVKNFGLETKLINKNYNRIAYLFGIKKTTILVLKSIIKRAISDELIYGALEEVGLLRQFAYRYPHEFSGGQRQRIVIARALISKPQIIIADEPIASLDISIQAQIVNLLKSLVEKKGIGMIFIAHDLSMVEYIADNIIIMHLGKIVERGKTEEIYKDPKHPYTINLFDSIPKMSNANEPFKASSFELDYLEEQRFPNEVVEGLVNDSQSHKLYGTEKQLKAWLNKNE